MVLIKVIIFDNDFHVLVGLSYSMLFRMYFHETDFKSCCIFSNWVSKLFTRLHALLCLSFPMILCMYIDEAYLRYKLVRFKGLMFCELLLLRYHCILVELLYVCSTSFVLVWFIFMKLWSCVVCYCMLCCLEVTNSPLVG